MRGFSENSIKDTKAMVTLLVSAKMEERPRGGGLIGLGEFKSATQVIKWRDNALPT